VDVVLWPFEAGKEFARWACLQEDARKQGEAIEQLESLVGRPLAFSKPHSVAYFYLRSSRPLRHRHPPSQFTLRRRPLSQLIQFEGQTHRFPDDFSQAEIQRALRGLPRAVLARGDCQRPPIPVRGQRPNVAAYLLERPVRNPNASQHNINLRPLIAADNAARESGPTER
jgi:hypothetical protein